LAILAGCAALGGCGQRGPLYMPVVPPLPPKPTFDTQTPAAAAQPDSPADTAAPLQLTPAATLRSASGPAASSVSTSDQ